MQTNSSRPRPAVYPAIFMMEIQTKETTRSNTTLARFGGRTWEVIGRHYDTVTLRDGNVRIYVHVDQIEPVGVSDEPAPGINRRG